MCKIRGQNVVQKWQSYKAEESEFWAANRVAADCGAGILKEGKQRWVRQFKSPCASTDFSTVHAGGENLSSQELEEPIKDFSSAHLKGDSI